MSYRDIDLPQEFFGGRTFNTVFGSAAAGCGADQGALAEYVLLTLYDQGRIPPEVGLALAELWATQAIYQGEAKARGVLVNTLLRQARDCCEEDRDKALLLFAEVLSWLDEMAADDDMEAARSMDNMLTCFVAVGGTEEERAAMVTRAKEMREWRAARHSPAR
jgi:hypothetical protein